MPAVNEAIERLTREVLSKKEAWKKHVNKAMIEEFLHEI